MNCNFFDLISPIGYTTIIEKEEEEERKTLLLHMYGWFVSFTICCISNANSKSYANEFAIELTETVDKFIARNRVKKCTPPADFERAYMTMRSCECCVYLCLLVCLCARWGVHACVCLCYLHLIWFVYI